MCSTRKANRGALRFVVSSGVVEDWRSGGLEDWSSGGVEEWRSGVVSGGKDTTE